MGYGISYGLNYRDVAMMEHCFWVADKAGFPLNAFLTYTPPRSMPAEDRRRKFSQYRGHLGQELAIRNGYPFMAMLIREWKLEDEHDAGEHLHGLIHLPDSDAMQLASGVASELVKIEWNDGTTSGDFARLLYVQKQRDHNAEGLVKKNERPHIERELPAPICGRRWSLSTPLHELVKRDRKAFVYPSNKKFLKPPNYKPKAAPLRLVVNNPVVLAPFDRDAWLASLPVVTPQPALPPARRKRKPAREIDNRGRQADLFPRPDIRAMIDSIGPNNATRARLLGVTESHLRNLKTGFYRPSLEVQQKLEALAA